MWQQNELERDRAFKLSIKYPTQKLPKDIHSGKWRRRKRPVRENSYWYNKMQFRAGKII